MILINIFKIINLFKKLKFALTLEHNEIKKINKND